MNPCQIRDLHSALLSSGQLKKGGRDSLIMLANHHHVVNISQESSLELNKTEYIDKLKSTVI